MGSKNSKSKGTGATSTSQGSIRHKKFKHALLGNENHLAPQPPTSSSFHPAKSTGNRLPPENNIIHKPVDHESLPKKRPAPLPPKIPIEVEQPKQETMLPKQPTVTRNFSAHELEKCNEVLKEGVKDALKSHDEIMQRFIGTSNGVYKEKQIKEYHSQTSKVVIHAFRQSLNGLRQLKQPKVNDAVEEAEKSLQSKLQSQLVVYQRKHEIMTENYAKDIKMNSIHAENAYHHHMDSYENKTKDELRKRHNEAESIAMNELKLRLEKSGFYTEGNMAELKERLRESLDALLEEWEQANPNLKNQPQEISLIQLHETLPNPDRHLYQVNNVKNEHSRTSLEKQVLLRKMALPEGQESK